MSSPNQIIQQSQEDIERSYNTKLFIVDKDVVKYSSGFIRFVRLKLCLCLVKEHYTHTIWLPLLRLPVK